MKKRRTENAVDYWDTLADAMLALFLCILLIVLLFILYFVQVPPYGEHVDDLEGDDDGGATIVLMNPEQSPDPHHYDDPQSGSELHQQDPSPSGGGAGGDDGREHEGDSHGDREEEEDEHRWAAGDKGEKAAVLVEVVDGETLLPLAREGIEFELYDANMWLQTLNDYYPARVEHTRFATTERGQFYLPEKIREGNYFLRALTEVEGYGPAEDTPFYLDDYYDWEDPFHVTVKMYPLRSVIRLRLVDSESGEGLSGASFRVIAAENVVTLDGTVRFHTGETVGVIETGVNGYGESRELYFGKYLLRQEQTPEFYGIIDHDVHTELKVKTANAEATTEILQAEKTAMIVFVRDALYDDVPVAGAKFSLSAGRETDTAVSDSSGLILLTDLKQNTSYRIRQIGASSDYRINPVDHVFTVDKNGLISGAVRQELIIGNRMIRTSFSVTGTLLANRMSDIRMALTDPQGNIVRQWTTSGADTLITGLEPGSYRLIIGGDTDNPIDIYVADEAGLQAFRYTRWTSADTLLAAIAGVILLGAAVTLIVSAKRRKTRPQRGKETR